MSISLFGAPQIKRGNRQISIQRRKDLALLAYLVVTAQPHSRDSLATLLWPDSDQSLARANFRKNLSRLKSDLGDGVIWIAHDQVGLDPNLSLWLDVEQFQSLISQSRKHNHLLLDGREPLCSDCQTALEQAVKLYRGGFLEGFAVADSATFEEWQFFLSEGYRQSLGEALQQLAQHYIYCEDYNPAIEHGRRRLSLDPLHEPAHRQLMLAYALSGQQAAALRQFDECVRLLKAELGLEPEPETIQLRETIQKKKIGAAKELHAAGLLPQKESSDDRSESSRQKINHNLPAAATPFIGRVRELKQIRRSLEEPACRIVTLLGPGGSGKTRLSIQAGLQLNDEQIFRDGIWFIQLAPLTEQSSIVPAIQKELNISAYLEKKDPRRQLLDHLKNKQMLLILDNFEHLLGEESILLIADLLKAAPQIKILMTSRERLSIQGEHLFPVEGLDISSNGSLLPAPETDPDMTGSTAVQLFEQSARRVQPSFKVTRGNLGAITRICKRVQGMPLAIELAASWLEILSLEEIDKEVKKDIDFLRSDLHDLPDRQRSLRAVFDSSWDKLNKSTRSTVKALSVFRSNFSRDTAQAILCLSVKTLLELTNKSWIQPQPNGKYQMHELLRQFAFEKLRSDAVTYNQIRKQYCSHYTDHLASLWKLLKGPGQSRVFAELESEFENIRTAWIWLRSMEEYEAAVTNLLPVLFFYSEIRGKSLELVDMIEKMLIALECSPQTPDQSKMEVILRTAQGAFWSDGHPLRYEFFDGVYPVDLPGIKRAWSLMRKSYPLHELGFWGILLAFIYGRTNNTDEAIECLKQAIPSFQEQDDPWMLANAKLHLARLIQVSEVKDEQGTNQEIDAYLHETLDLFNAIGDGMNGGHTLRQIGNLRMREQNLPEAVAQWKAARASLLTVDVDEWAAASSINWQIGDAYLQLGQFEEAYQCFQEISRVNLEHGFIQQAVGALSKESFEKARYGDLADAIRIRQRCLELVQMTGPDYQIAWNQWEMGELMRLSNRTSEAAKWFESARETFEKYHDHIGLAFYWRGMGDLALLHQDFDTAGKNFRNCLEQARLGQHHWVAAYSLSGICKTKLELHHRAEAEDCLTQALSLARKAHDPGITLSILTNAVQLYEQKGKTDFAVRLGGLILQHFASWNETKARTEVLLSTLKRGMPSKQFNELRKNGRSLDLWKTVDEILAGN